MFQDDYSEGCHPRILEALIATNLATQPGYGDDEYSEEARALIRDLIGNPDAAVHFVSGGTQANLIVISAFLRPHEAVIAAETGHVLVNETGAIEATGHKIIAVPGHDGKLTPEGVLTAMRAHTQVPHVVKPKLVYLSNATELGTVYRRDELMALSQCCREHDLYLFVDGARMATALCSEHSDLTAKDLGSLVDVFYLGGTKNGALLGEAIVINHPALAAEFGYSVKQRGAMLAKGRVLGLQFLTLLRDGLYFDLAAHANAQAAKLSHAMTAKSYPLLVPTESNQVFPILPMTKIEVLQERFRFLQWQVIDDNHAAVRFVTSWATPDDAVEALIAAL